MMSWVKALYLCIPTQNSKTWLTYIAKWVCFGPLFFNLSRLIQLCDKKNLTFVDCWDKMILNSSWKNVIKRAFNIFQDSFNKILSQQLTHDRSYISHEPILGSSTSADMMSKILTNGDTIFWLSKKHCGKIRNCSLRAISSFPQCFQKLFVADVLKWVSME